MPPSSLDALEILRQRYANGEIDGTTFDQMRERLEGSSGGR
jgi:putative membrane protein